MANYTSTSSPDWEEYSDSLNKITVASGVTKIGNYAFFGLDNVTSVTLNEGLQTIGTYAFHYCSALESLEIPSTVENIGRGSFGNSGIYATELSKPIVVELSDGTKVRYAATDWVKSILTYSTISESKSLARAMYYYSKAAKDYFA